MITEKVIAYTILMCLVVLTSTYMYLFYVNHIQIEEMDLPKAILDLQVFQYNQTTTEPQTGFYEYTCLSRSPNDSLTDSLTSEAAGCVRTISRVNNRFDNTPNDTCVTLKNINHTICTYDPKDDLVSRNIHTEGIWEEKLVDNLMKALQMYPNLTFLDLGCNIGVYTIAAGSMRAHAVCVDANVENLRLVYKSAQFGHLEKYVTIIWNALSDYRGEVNLKVVKGNVGASRLGDTEKYQLSVSKHLKVRTILLDDLEWLFRGKQLFVKVDLESYELTVLRGATEFFKKIDVRFIQMELLERDTFHAVVDLLYSWGYLMFNDLGGKFRLDRQDFASSHWPGDIYFIKLTYLHRQ